MIHDSCIRTLVTSLLMSLASVVSLSVHRALASTQKQRNGRYEEDDAAVSSCLLCLALVGERTLLNGWMKGDA